VSAHRSFPQTRHRGRGQDRLTHRTRPNEEQRRCRDHDRPPLVLSQRQRLQAENLKVPGVSPNFELGFENRAKALQIPVGFLSSTTVYERKRTLAEEASTETCGSGAFGSATQPWPSCNLTNFNMHYD
jgi:hypothetical protein